MTRTESIATKIHIQHIYTEESMNSTAHLNFASMPDEELHAKIDQIFDRMAKSLSTELGLHVTKEHVIWARCSVSRQGYRVNDPGFSEMLDEAVRNAIALKLDVKALLLDDDDE